MVELHILDRFWYLKQTKKIALPCAFLLLKRLVPAQSISFSDTGRLVGLNHQSTGDRYRSFCKMKFHPVCQDEWVKSRGNARAAPVTAAGVSGGSVKGE